MADAGEHEEYVMVASDGTDEQQRLDLQHQIWLLTLHDRLYTVPLPTGSGDILDIGCGTGAWSLDMAKHHPGRTITAIDLTPPSVTHPSNVKFMRLNVENDWAFERPFNFIHGRMLTSGIHDWPRLLRQCFENLQPGGWLELLDICHPFGAENLDASKDGSSPKSGFLQWGRTAEHCWALKGLDYRAATKHVKRLEELGFIDIQERELKWPLGTWPENERERLIGDLTLWNFNNFVTAAGAKILRQDPNITDQEAQDLVKAASEDLAGNCCTRNFYLTIMIHTARKPNCIESCE